MTYGSRILVPLVFTLALLAGPPTTQAQEHPGGGHPEAARPEPHPAARPEPHPAPRGYHPVVAPRGWNVRPKTADPAAYGHNYQAPRTFKIGPYHPPGGWTAQRWTYGETLPRAYWAAEYLLADYWLFGLEVPPVGYEWVRDGSDAILVNVNTGLILQVEYGVFA
jgi:Ni/Co efflux regulator RcnB